MAPLHALVAALLLAPSPDASVPRTRIALIPFENVPRIGAARSTVMETVEATLARKGFEVVPGAPIEEFLRSRRIRYLDAIPSDQVGELLGLVGADVCLSGTILAWDANERDPVVALAARVVTREGKPLWTAAGGLAASETEGVLGLGRVANVRALSDRLVGTLLGSLPDVHLESVRLPPGRRAGGGALPHVFRSPALAGKELKVAVLPLQNFSEARDAPRMAEAVLQQRLVERPSFTVVGPADLRAAVVRAGLRNTGQLSAEQLRALAKEVGTPLFLRGAVLAWGPSTEGAWPAIELYLSLLDAESGRTLWSGLHRREGLDYVGWFQRGTVKEATAVASRTVAEMLDAFTAR
jgi:hypothetical protein